jgi:hypothetical protein
MRVSQKQVIDAYNLQKSSPSRNEAQHTKDKMQKTAKRDKDGNPADSDSESFSSILSSISSVAH